MSGTGWTFLSNHTHVLVCLAGDGTQTLREVAAKVGVTERAVQRIVADLEEGGVLERRRDGRRNTYVIHADVALRHPLEAHCRIGDLIGLVVSEPSTPLAKSAPRTGMSKALRR
jgi:DNA-binding transcriptional ArsR family regulator